MLKSSICCFTPVGHLPHKILDPEDDDDYSDTPSQLGRRDPAGLTSTTSRSGTGASGGS
ncbi:unnamed protein product [Linum tenue]|uniref:Uncharacterized protein n=1 Tax=Linum tenue TaxID=586396 RepID=A0AAV0MDV8_9ROSI|nr:unnamed protein product [Linum tenue]